MAKALKEGSDSGHKPFLPFASFFFTSRIVDVLAGAPAAVLEQEDTTRMEACAEDSGGARKIWRY